MATNGQKIEFNSADIGKKPKKQLITNVKKENEIKQAVKESFAKKYRKRLIALGAVLLVLIAAALVIFFVVIPAITSGGGTTTGDGDTITDQRFSQIVSDTGREVTNSLMTGEITPDEANDELLDLRDNFLGPDGEETLRSRRVDIQRANTLITYGAFDDAILSILTPLWETSTSNEEKFVIANSMMYAYRMKGDRSGTAIWEARTGELEQYAPQIEGTGSNGE